SFVFEQGYRINKLIVFWNLGCADENFLKRAFPAIHSQQCTEGHDAQRQGAGMGILPQMEIRIHIQIEYTASRQITLGDDHWRKRRLGDSRGLSGNSSWFHDCRGSSGW